MASQTLTLGLALLASVALTGCGSAGPAPLGAGLADVWGGVSVVRAQATPDGAHVLLATRAADGSVRPLRWFLYRCSDGRTLALTHGDAVLDRTLDAEVWLRPDGAELAVLHGDRIHIVSVADGAVLAELDRSAVIAALPGETRLKPTPAVPEPTLPTPAVPEPLPTPIPSGALPAKLLPPKPELGKPELGKPELGKLELGRPEPDFHEPHRRELPRFEPADGAAYFAELQTRQSSQRLAQRFWAMRAGGPLAEPAANAATVAELPVVPPSYVSWSADRYGVAAGLSNVTVGGQSLLSSDASQTARTVLRTVLLPADVLAAALEQAFRGPAASGLRAAARLR